MWGTSRARSSGEQNGVYFENGKSVCVANYCQRLCWHWSICCHACAMADLATDNVYRRMGRMHKESLSFFPAATACILVKVDGVTASLCILHHCKVVCRESKRV